MYKSKIYGGLFALLILLSLTSCGASRRWRSAVKPHEVHELAHFAPFSCITVLDRDGHQQVDDSLSAVATDAQYAVMKSFFELPIVTTISPKNPELFRTMQEEMDLLCLAVMRRESVRDIPIPPTLRRLLKQEGQRFGLVTVVEGFDRSPENYGRAVASSVGKAVVRAILSYGYDLRLDIPSKLGTTTYFVVLDALRNEIAFFDVQHGEVDPLSRNQQMELFAESVRRFYR